MFFRKISILERSINTLTNYLKKYLFSGYHLHFENSKNSVPEIVQVESYLSTSTSTERMSEEDSETSSEESVGNRGEGDTPQIRDDVFMVTMAHTSANVSYTDF